MSNLSGGLSEFMQNQDLFSMWEKELHLRHEIRLGNKAALNIPLAKAHELDLYYRSWYFSPRRMDFFRLLIEQLNNTDNIEVLKWLGDAPDHLQQNFWTFLPWYILLHAPNPSQLQFIVNLYRPELYQEML
jgi:hypothetical protein